MKKKSCWWRVDDVEGEIVQVASFRRSKFERNRIGAVAFVGRSAETFAIKDMANVASTSSAADLSPRHTHALIDVEIERSIDSLVEGRPTATGVKFGFRFVKRRFTPCTQVLPILIELVILTYRRSIPWRCPYHPIVSG